MKWLRISNPGHFDIDNALNMLGASVKTGTNPIGMFGSGTKYAISQACRDNISLKISTNGKVYTATTERKDFRNVEFKKVVLRSETGGEIKTPMTTAFGDKDWKDIWYIFREFFSNAIDEGSRRCDIVDGVETIDGHTCVFLPYNDFKHIYENLEKYFTKHEEGLWAGDGCVYRNGVFVGQFIGCKINFHASTININECRVMDMYDAKADLSRAMRYCGDVDVWVEFLKTDRIFLEGCSVELNRYHDIATEALHNALVKVYGENYCICPDINDILRDTQSMGYVPVVLRGVTVSHPKIKTYFSLDESASCRKMTPNEESEFNSIRKSISAFIPDDCQPTIKVISDGAAEILGQADITNKIVYIRECLFNHNNKKELVNTIIHEFGHIISKKGDYDRTFTNFFINALVELSM